MSIYKGPLYFFRLSTFLIAKLSLGWYRIDFLHSKMSLEVFRQTQRSHGAQGPIIHSEFTLHSEFTAQEPKVFVQMQTHSTAQAPPISLFVPFLKARQG